MKVLDVVIWVVYAIMIIACVILVIRALVINDMVSLVCSGALLAVNVCSLVIDLIKKFGNKEITK